MSGIQLGTNFTVNTALPLDDRDVVADIAARDAIVPLRRYEGMVVYVITEAMNYQLIGGIDDANWQEFSGGGGGGDCCYVGIVWDNVSSAPNVQEITDTTGQIILQSGIQQGLYVKGDGGPSASSIDPFSSEPEDGTIIFLKGMNSTEYLVIPESDTDGGVVGGGDIYLYKDSTVTLVYNLAIKRYLIMGRS